MVLKVILFLNIVVTLVPALLVTFNLEFFEVLSHELEYLNEITMSFVDLVFLYSLCQTTNQNGAISNDTVSVYIAIGSFIIAIIQLGLYNGFGQNENGDMKGEIIAHYCEFIFEMGSSMITFWFTLDNMIEIDQEISAILYGNHEDCVSCRSQRSIHHQPVYEAIPRSVKSREQGEVKDKFSIV